MRNEEEADRMVFACARNCEIWPAVSRTHSSPRRHEEGGKKKLFIFFLTPQTAGLFVSVDDGSSYRD